MSYSLPERNLAFATYQIVQEWNPVSGSHRSGDHRSDRYRGSESGGYTTPSGGYRTGSGGYRSSSGSYRPGTGSHRVVRERRAGRRVAIMLAGVGAGAAVCVLAVVAILNGAGSGGDRDSGQVVGSGATESSPASEGERSIVPDACTMVGDDLAGRLAPDAERDQADNYQGNDRQNQCVWGAYAGNRKRQLTVELRAVAGTAGRSPTGAARIRFAYERRDDESGKALLAGQELTDKVQLTSVGDEGYVVYSVDKGQGSGEAIANIRSVNTLITIHYSGSNDGAPLASRDAVNGAEEAAKAVLRRLTAG